MDSEVDAAVRELSARFQRLYGDRLSRMVLFGSHARGEAERDSDIDVLVVLRGRVRPAVEVARTGQIVAELSRRCDRTVSCVFMDEQRFSTRQGPFLRNVRNEGIPV